MSTKLEDKIAILAELFLNHSSDEDFEDFFEVNDLGLPLAYLCANGYATHSDSGVSEINSTFADLLELFEVEDTGFERLSEITELEE
jgi:hypothetical protein